MRRDDFDYELPQELIAQHPPVERGGSRLLCLDGATGKLVDRMFREIVSLVDPGDVMVFNDTRVIRARLTGRKQTGGRCEVMIERVTGPGEVLAQIGVNHPPRAGGVLLLEGGIEASVVERRGELYRLRFEGCENVFDLIERAGAVPLPLYISRAAEERDAACYQTVYARERGAVAAPTAGLHFDEALLGQLAAHGVRLAFLTLHVGSGTFQPVRTQEVAEHVMHSEWYQIPQATVAAVAAARAAGGRVLAVGTTSLRALETAAAGGELGAGCGETSLFILPGYRFRVVDRLLTNFHLPRSTLLMLVAAFAGLENIRGAYRHAIDRRYQFFSYGDAMLIERQN